MVLLLGVLLMGSGALGFRELAALAGLGFELLFVAFFLRHLAFAISALRAAPRDVRAPLIDSGWRPTVTVMVSCHNEASVVDRLIDGLLALDYPLDRLQLLVIDDRSVDGTGARLAARAADAPSVQLLQRPIGTTGGKSAALNHGLRHATGDIIVVFDADHRPRPDVVLRLVRHFADPVVASAQGRCVIANGDDSPLARLVALDYLGGYLVNEYGRQSLFHLPAYGGANCAVRASTLQLLGGWNEQSVTEDTDLTLRLVLAGYRVRYDVTAIDEEEGVVTLGHFWRQRYRWARGHQQVWRDYRGAVVRSPRLDLAEKVETLMFLLAFHVPVLSACGLALLALNSLGTISITDIPDASVLWTLLFLGPLLELGGGLVVAGAPRRHARAVVGFLPLFFVSIGVCTKALVDGTLGTGYTWVKTARAADSPNPVASR